MLQSDAQLATAKKLCQEGNHRNALPILEAMHKSAEMNAPSFFVGSLLLTCYQKLSMWDSALSLGEELCSLCDCWQSIKLSYAWVIYFHAFKNRYEQSIEEAIRKIDTIEELLAKDTQKLPLILAIFNLVSKNNQMSSELGIQLLEKLDFQALKTYVPSKSSGTSFAEQYTSLYSKALFSGEKFSKCVAFCRCALDETVCLTEDNRIWMLRRLALSHYRLGDAEQAFTILQQVILLKPEWYILFELAQVCDTLQKASEALQFAARAATANGELEMKIHLWHFLYKLLLKAKRFPEAVNCLSLVASIRVNKAWKLDSALISEIALYNLKPEDLPEPILLFKQLKPLFQDFSADPSSTAAGVITRLLPHGKAGFIKSGENSYYFRTSDLCFPAAQIVSGIKVLFCLQKSFDPKKQTESKIAVNIRLVN